MCRTNAPAGALRSCESVPPPAGQHIQVKALEDDALIAVRSPSTHRPLGLSRSGHASGRHVAWPSSHATGSCVRSHGRCQRCSSSAQLAPTRGRSASGCLRGRAPHTRPRTPSASNKSRSPPRRRGIRRSAHSGVCAQHVTCPRYMRSLASILNPWHCCAGRCGGWAYAA